MKFAATKTGNGNCMRNILLPFVCFILLGASLRAQGYQAVHGSPFTGATAIFNNPAASITSAYKWDVTLFSVQAKVSTNAAYLNNFTLGNQSNAELTIDDQYHTRWVHNNMDASLFNIQYKINNTRAVSAGLRVRSYTHSKAAPFWYSDTTSTLKSFLIQNANTPFLDAFATSSSWLEGDLNYSQVLFENSSSRLSGGITLQIMKGLSGSYARLSKLSYLMSKFTNDTSFSFTNGNLGAAYSANLGASGGKDYLDKTLGGLGLSLGMEYMIYNSENASGNNNINYDWKIGLSVMDIGANKFIPGAGSGTYNNPQLSVNDNDVDRKFSGAGSVRQLSDSLRTIFQGGEDLTDNFSINNPTRLIINVDRNFGNNFFVNADLSLNFYSSVSYKSYNTRELNLLTVTPRWETTALGAYLPIQYNTQGQLWFGAALKLGPLTMGVHDLGILFKKDPYLNGGAYLMFAIHPFSRSRVLSKLDCYE